MVKCAGSLFLSCDSDRRQFQRQVLFQRGRLGLPVTRRANQPKPHLLRTPFPAFLRYDTEASLDCQRACAATEANAPGGSDFPFCFSVRGLSFRPAPSPQKQSRGCSASSAPDRRAARQKFAFVRQGSSSGAGRKKGMARGTPFPAANEEGGGRHSSSRPSSEKSSSFVAPSSSGAS
jgi:hypothetical protein